MGSQLLRGVTDLIVLAALEHGESYGYELAKRLEAYGFEGLTEQTVYGTLRRLARDGRLATSLRRAGTGPARRYYRLTEHGRSTLKRVEADWCDFVASVTLVLGARDQYREAP